MVRIASIVCLLFFSGQCIASVTVTSMNLVGSVRTGRTTYDYTYTLSVKNGADAQRKVVAKVTSSSITTIVLNGQLNLGDLAGMASVTSAETFSIRQDRTAPFDPASLHWTFEAENNTANLPPVLSLSAKSQLYQGETLVLDASASNDPDGDAVAYKWSVLSRPPSSISVLVFDDAPQSWITVDKAGTYKFRLTGSDGKSISSKEISVVALARPASALAGSMPDIISFDFMRDEGRPLHEGSFEIQGDPIRTETLAARAKLDRSIDSAYLRMRDFSGKELAVSLLKPSGADGPEDYEFWTSVTIPSVPFTAEIFGTYIGVPFTFHWPRTYIPQRMRVDLKISPSGYLGPGKVGDIVTIALGPDANQKFDVYVEADGVELPGGSEIAGVVVGPASPVHIPIKTSSIGQSSTTTTVTVTLIATADSTVANKARIPIHVENLP